MNFSIHSSSGFAFTPIAVATSLALSAINVQAAAITNSIVLDGDTQITESLESNIWTGLFANGADRSVSVKNNGTIFIRDASGPNKDHGTSAVYVINNGNLTLDGNLDIDVSNSTNSVRSFWVEGNAHLTGNIKAVATALGESNLAEALTLRGTGNTLTFEGERTHLIAEVQGGRVLGVENFNTGGGVINFNADQTIIEAVTTEDAKNYAQGILAYQSTTNFKGDVVIKTKGGTWTVYGIDVQCDPGNAFDTIVAIEGDAEISAEGTQDVYAVRPSGVPGTISIGGNATISAHSASGMAMGIRSQYGALTQVDGDLAITSSSDEGDAVGVAAIVYANYAGSVHVGGSLNANVEAGDVALGIQLDASNGQDVEGDGILSIGQNAVLDVTGASAVGIQAKDAKADLRIEGNVDIAAKAETGDAAGILVEDGAGVALMGSRNLIHVETAGAEAKSTGISITNGSLELAGTTTVSGADLGLSVSDPAGQVILLENSTLQVESMQSSGEVSLGSGALLDIAASDASSSNTLGSIAATNATIALGAGTYTLSSVQGAGNTVRFTDLPNTASVTIDSRSDGLIFSASGESNDQYGNASATGDALAALIRDQVGADLGDSIVVEEGRVNDGLTADIDADTGELNNVTLQKNSTLDALGSVAVLKAAQWRHERSSLEDRMASLRDGHETFGSWIRMYGSEMEYGAQRLTSKNTSIELGFDKPVTNQWTVGASFSYTDGSADYDRGGADLEAYGLGLYGTWAWTNAVYVDLSAKYNRFSSDLTVNGTKGSTDNNAFSASVELGWRLPVAQSIFIEPTATLSYGRITGDDYSLTNGVRLNEDDIDSLIAGAGVRLGLEFPENAGQFFARAQVFREFEGDVGAIASIDTASNRYDESIQDTYAVFGVGGVWHWTNATLTSVSLERSTGGDVKENWRWNINLRYAF